MENIINFTAKALLNIAPNSQFTTADNKVTQWFSEDIPQPTEAEIDAEIVRLQAEYDNQQYQRDRQYPSLEEQADMAYWDRKNGTTTLDDALDAVKAEYPKPTE